MEINISNQSTVANIFSNFLKVNEETYQFSVVFDALLFQLIELKHEMR